MILCSILKDLLPIFYIFRIFVFRVFDKLKWNAKDTVFRDDESLLLLLPYNVFKIVRFDRYI